MNRVDSFATVVFIHAVQFREKSGGKWWSILNLSESDDIRKEKIVSRLFKM